MGNLVIGGSVLTAKGRKMGRRQHRTKAIVKKMSVLLTEEYLEKRAKHGSQEAFERILAKVPSVEPAEDDRL